MEAKANKVSLPSWLRIVLIGRRPKYTAIRLIVIVVISVIIASKRVLLPIRVVGPSMEPTYHDGSANVVNRLAYVFHEPRRGDVVAIRYADVSVMLMKRVVGLPGETISFSRGQLFINGEPAREPYMKFRCRWNSASETLGPDEYYVVGDNRAMNIRDHEHGKAERIRIVGKVLL